jgi:hypothetical protein
MMTTITKARANDTLRRTGDTFEVVSMMAFLAGVPEHFFKEEGNTGLQLTVFQNLEQSKPARIIRNSCRLRTTILRHFGELVGVMNSEHKIWESALATISDDRGYAKTRDMISSLSQDGVTIKSKLRLDDCLIEINRLVGDRIGNCKDIFPSWLCWDYVRKLFIMPNGFSVQGTKAAGELFLKNLSAFPFRVYINHKPFADNGSVFYNDEKFVTWLYQQNHDEFTDMSKITDVSECAKNSIYSFIENSTKSVFAVDCENSNPYKVFAALRGLGSEYRNKISKIILYADPNVIETWSTLEKFVDIPVEYIRVERLKSDKSMTDMKLAAGVCREFYQEEADSFILAASDSDYWSLISSLPEAKFLVMIETEKTASVMLNALREAKVLYCCLDKFYTGDSDAIKLPSLCDAAQNHINSCVNLNVHDVMKHAFTRTRIEMNDSEKKSFLEKYLKRLELQYDNNGNVTVVFKRSA